MEIDQEKKKVTIEPKTLTEVLGLNLTIPQYQRAYVWRLKVVKTFLSDILNWMKGCRKDDDQYHLGTIVLKELISKKVINEGMESFEETEYRIVDGQQRLITLALLAKKLGCENLKILSKEIRGGVNAVKRAWNALDEFAHDCNKDYLSKLEFSVITIPESVGDELAYAFFDNTNTLGKRLSDYDLLKTHHLRFVKDGYCQGFCASRWNDLVTTDISDILPSLSDVEFTRTLFNDCLYRLRMWSMRGGVSFVNSDETEWRELYTHFSSTVDDYNPVGTETKVAVELDRIVVGGLPFFEYTEFYRSRFVEYLSNPAVGCLINNLYSVQKGVICRVAIACGFAAFCRFGDWHLADMIIAITCVVSALRLAYAVQERMITWRSCSNQSLIYLLPEGGWNRYISSVVKYVLHAPSDIVLIELLKRKEFRYKIDRINCENKKEVYWLALEKFVKNCPSKIVDNKVWMDFIKGGAK